MLIAAGIAALGDSPAGWRCTAALAGALALVGVYAWVLALRGRPSLALWAASLTAFNQLLFVQSRIAMPDVFMVSGGVHARHH
jgi:dolichyl-phosphate-mannose-protein mannosyltransferase